MHHKIFSCDHTQTQTRGCWGVTNTNEVELLLAKFMVTALIVACLHTGWQPARSSCHLRSCGERRPLSSQVTAQPCLRCPWLLTWLAGQADLFFRREQTQTGRRSQNADSRSAADARVSACAWYMHGMMFICLFACTCIACCMHHPSQGRPHGPHLRWGWCKKWCPHCVRVFV